MKATKNETQKKAELIVYQAALNMANSFINNHNFDLVAFDQNYNKGATPENVHFGYHFALTCADMMTMKSEHEIQQKTPNILKILSRLNDSEFSFGLECFKNRMEMYNPVYSERPNGFERLIRESVANTGLETHQVIQKITENSKDKAIKNIATMKETSAVINVNKLKNS